MPRVSSQVLWSLMCIFVQGKKTVKVNDWAEEAPTESEKEMMELAAFEALL